MSKRGSFARVGASPAATGACSVNQAERIQRIESERRGLEVVAQRHLADAQPHRERVRVDAPSCVRQAGAAALDRSGDREARAIDPSAALFRSMNAASASSTVSCAATGNVASSSTTRRPARFARAWKRACVPPMSAARMTRGRGTSRKDAGPRRRRDPVIACAGAPDRSRTCDLWLRKPTLYPTELRAL